MKKKLAKIMIVMLPLLALVLATTGDSVTLINVETGAKLSGSYFEMLGDSGVAMCPVLAATCSILSLLMAVIFLTGKKKACLSASAWLSFAGACIASLPMVFRGETILIPHVLFSIFLLLQFVLCAFAARLGLYEKDLPEGRRLEKH